MADEILHADSTVDAQSVSVMNPLVAEEFFHCQLSEPVQLDSMFQTMQAILQGDLTQGWQDFLNSPHFQTLKEFALFLDDITEFQDVHRKRIPHPAHEYAARLIGIPVTKRLTSWGLAPSHWFPGDFYASEETDLDGPNGSHVHARVFTLGLLFDCGRQKLCQLSFAFPHLHDGFGFLQPIVKISERYASDPYLVQRCLSQLTTEMSD